MQLFYIKFFLFFVSYYKIKKIFPHMKNFGLLNCITYRKPQIKEEEEMLFSSL